MPKYRVKYTFEVEVESPNKNIARINADYHLDNDLDEYYLWDYETHTEVIELEVPEDLKEEIETGKDIALSFGFKDNYDPITDGFVADEFIKDEDLRKIIWPENENFEIPIDNSETIKIETVDSVTASELYEKRMLDNLVNYTCHLCKDKNKCKYAFDDYCTDGDCLMEK